MKKVKENNRFIGSSQAVAEASWINYLNQQRINRYLCSVAMQDTNLENAIKSLEDTISTLNKKIIITNRGGIKGQHGFIAEVAECGIENARNEIVGNNPSCKWINDNGPADILRDGIPIQQKFVNSGNHLSLQAIKKHYDTYPFFLNEGGKYQIPKDHYEKIKYLLSVPKEQANKLSTSTEDFSLRQWKEVHDFFESEKIKLSDIEPSVLSYDEVQANQINKTIEKEKNAIKETDRTIREKEYNKSKPKLKEGLKVGAVSAAIEGGTSLVSEIAKRIKSGKSIRDFTGDDWADIVKSTTKGTVLGAVRGISIYELTNYTPSSAIVANSLVAVSFGIAQQIYLLHSGRVSKQEFVRNAELLCVEASVCTISSTIGQAVIPIPVIGAVIGNTVGLMVYNAVKDIHIEQSTLILQYLSEISKLEYNLNQEFSNHISELMKLYKEFFSVMENAFAIDYKEAFSGSIELARIVGVQEDSILTSVSDIDNYFLQ